MAGITQVIAQQDQLNKINVFPVADGDTGTNMASTLSNIIDSTEDINFNKISEMFASIADAALDGSRGNSGAIMAQFFQGMSDGLKDNHENSLSTKDFAKAIQYGTEYAYEAISEPQEGTILSVLRDFSQQMIAQVERGDSNFTAVLESGIETAEKSLKETTNQLKELKKFGVVDAGAQGFVDMLNGMLDFMKDGKIKKIYQKVSQTTLDKIDEFVHGADEKYRFCTECLINGENINHKELRQKLAEFGNSLIVAGSVRKAKVHLHTNKPAKVFKFCSAYGKVTGEKADDMQHQKDSIHKHHANTAIVCDSSVDLPESVMEELDIYMVPLKYHFGEEGFIDKVSLTAEQFYQKLASSKSLPTTSQPTLNDFKRQFLYLSSHYKSVISLNLPRVVSGTIRAAELAAERIEGAHISVVDTLNVSVASGLVALYAAEAAKAGKSHDEILSLIDSVIPKTHFYVAIQDLSYAVRGGRIPKAKKRIADFLFLTPILTFDHEGKSATPGMLFGKCNIAKKLAKWVTKKLDDSKTYRIGISHTNAKDKAERLLEQIKPLIKNLDSSFIMDCCITAGVHSGPGSIGVAVQEYIPFDQQPIDAEESTELSDSTTTSSSEIEIETKTTSTEKS